MKFSFTYRNLFAWLLLLTYLLNPFRIYQPYLEYQLNYEYISTVLCINKAKPELECHGKCHLQDQLKKTAEEESEKQSTASVNCQLEELSGDKEIAVSPSAFLLEEFLFAFYSEKEYIFSPSLTNPPPRV